MALQRTPWPHAPTHELSMAGAYFVTAGTHLKAHRFCGAARLSYLQLSLLSVASEFGWRVEAWAVFSNHYHFVAQSPPGKFDAVSLSALIRTLHVKTAGWLNGEDLQPERRVWFNYWDSRLSDSRSYLARLNYVHQNAVKHGLVAVANQYPWCSAAWFERVASASIVKSIYRFKTDRIQVHDVFEPSLDW